MWNRLKEIYEYRDMIAGLVHRDLRGRYKGSFMGFLWNFINPLCQILVYIFVFSMIYRSNLEKYYVFLIVGMMPWNFFSESLCQGAGCVFAQGVMVKKIYFPREVLVISTVTSRFINFLINYLVAFAIILFSGLGFQFRIILMYLPAIMILEYIFTLGLALILASIDVYFRDIEYMTGVVTMAWIWLTPIMYPMDIVPPELSWIINLNPMTPIVRSYQNILYYKMAPDVASLVHVAVIAVLFLIAGELIFIKLEKRFAEEM